MVVLLHARVVRQLEPFAEGFADELARQGYSSHTRRRQLGLVAHLSRWIAERHVMLAELSQQLIERYISIRCHGGYRTFRSAKALTPLLDYLPGAGAVAAAGPETDADRE